jgi:glycosyltransferase involved in cell wall biosynthesis
MPAHNSSATISSAIDSVLAQTYQNWELLVINDNSSDNTEDIVNEYVKNDSRIKLFKTDKTFKRPFYPRNIGIENANGRFIAFLDSDDLWLPTKLEHQIPLFEMKDVAVVFSYYEKFDSQNDTNKNRIVKSSSVLTFKSALYGNQIGNLTGIYDTQKVGKVFFESIGHEDYVLWLTILKQGFKAKNTNTVEARYRVSHNSVSSNKGEAAKWTWNIYQNVLGFNILKSMYYFAFYMVKAVIKFSK